MTPTIADSYTGWNMCDLCGNDEERKHAIRRLQRQQDALREMASWLARLETGHAKPHDENKTIKSITRSIIKFMVEEYL